MVDPGLSDLVQRQGSIGGHGMTNLFRQHFLSKTQSAIGEANAIGKRGHAGLVGALREILVGRLLGEVLPPEVKIGDGQLVSRSGELSSQIDVILYAPSILPPATHDTKHGFFPVECCLYAIEVKTKLTLRGLRDAISSAKRLASLPLLPTEHWTPFTTDGSMLTMKPYGTPDPICAIFAFDSDLRGDPRRELKRYRSLDPHKGEKPAISIICIRGRGYWFCDSSWTWQFCPASDQLDEIMGFLAGVSNTVPQLLVAKGRPRFGNYLMLDGQLSAAD